MTNTLISFMFFSTVGLTLGQVNVPESYILSCFEATEAIWTFPSAPHAPGALVSASADQGLPSARAEARDDGG